MRKFFLAMSLLLVLSTPVLSAPLDLLGVKPGSTHKMGLGGAEILARVVQAGKEGWVLFEVLSDDGRWSKGTRLWINLDKIDNISVPYGK